MTKQEHLEKCKYVAGVLDKIINGVDVSHADKMNACANAIEVFCSDMSKKPNHVKKTPCRH